jgi:drug/metabolite transporter (DMT)-like permease
MRNTRTFALLALITAGVLWGTTVPLTKVALGWLGPGWLAVVRFTVAALLLAIPARRHLRAALTPSILAWGAAGFGVVLVVQNEGVARTSVSHGALLNASIPILVAIIAAVSGKSRVSALSWTGFGLATAGVAVVATGGGGSATLAGDGLVLAAVGLCAAFVAAQPRLLAGRDPMAVTAVQFGAGAVVALPYALGFDAPLAAPASIGPVLTVLGLIVGGTLLPFTLLAYGQARVAPEVAGAFLNLEPLVGALAGFTLFGDPAGMAQLLGAVAVLGGIGLTALPLIAPSPSRPPLAPALAGAGVDGQGTGADVGGRVVAEGAQHHPPGFRPAERSSRRQQRQREQAPRNVLLRRQERGGRQYDRGVYGGVVHDGGGQRVRDRRRGDRPVVQERRDLVERVGDRRRRPRVGVGVGVGVGGRRGREPEHQRRLRHERRPLGQRPAGVA